MRKLSEELKSIVEGGGEKHGAILDALKVAQSMSVKYAMKYFKSGDVQRGYIHLGDMIRGIGTAMRQNGQPEIGGQLAKIGDRMVGLREGYEGGEELSEMEAPKDIMKKMKEASSTAAHYAKRAEDAFGSGDFIGGFAELRNAFGGVGIAVGRFVKDRELSKKIEGAAEGIFGLARKYLDESD